MKRVLLFFLLCIILMLSGCGSKVPEHMKNPKTEYLQVEDYQRSEYSIPFNYRLIKNGIYAVLDDNDNVITSHSTSLVPCIITKEGLTLKNGKLGDVAPTILKLLDIEKPVEMTGEVLF